jgi:hypothetical protein
VARRERPRRGRVTVSPKQGRAAGHQSLEQLSSEASTARIRVDHEFGVSPFDELRDRDELRERYECGGILTDRDQFTDSHSVVDNRLVGERRSAIRGTGMPDEIA